MLYNVLSNGWIYLGSMDIDSLYENIYIYVPNACATQGVEYLCPRVADTA